MLLQVSTDTFKTFLPGLEKKRVYRYHLKRYRNGDETKEALYPNPVVDFVKLKKGRTLRSGRSNGSIDMREYPAGLYLIRIGPNVFRIVKL